MATPAYATDLTDIVTSFSTGWSLITEGGGGANSLTAPETDDFIQGTEAVSRNPFSSSIRGIIYDNAATVAVTTGDAIFYWWKADVAQALDTKAGGGVRLVMGTGTTAYKQFFVAGSDTYQLGGWRCVPLDPDDVGDLDRGTPGLPDYDFFGVAYDVPATGPSKGFPFKIDMIRHGRSIDITAGEIADPATWDKLTTYSDATARRWGIVQGTDTGAQLQGITNWGTASTSVYSRDEARAIVFVDTEFTISGFTQLVFNNASTDLVWDSMSFTALGTNNRGIVTVNNNAPVTITNSIFDGIDTTTDGGSNSVWDGTKWTGCNAVTSAGGSFLGASILVPTVAADTSAFIHNLAGDPDGELDNMTFSKGANAHHAIQFGGNSPATMTLRGCSFTGFNATNGNNDSALYFPDTGVDVDWTINLVGCSGDISYKKVRAGDTVTLVADPVTLLITVQDLDGTKIQNARVLALAAAGGPYASEDTVTITRSGTIASVSHTAHGMADGDLVVIKRADQNEYNGIKTITNVTANAYDFTVAGTPTTPATGTILATTAIISGLTDVNGQISDLRTYSTNQPLTGRVRKSSSSPYFKTANIVGTVNSTSGLTTTITMLSDE